MKDTGADYHLLLKIKRGKMGRLEDGGFEDTRVSKADHACCRVRCNGLCIRAAVVGPVGCGDTRRECLRGASILRQLMIVFTPFQINFLF